MKVTRRSVFKEDGFTVTGTMTLTVSLKDANAARRMVTRLCAGWSRTSVRSFLKSCPIPDKGLWTTPCGLIWVVGEPCFKIPIRRRADLFVSPQLKQIKIQYLSGPTNHGYWDDAIREAQCPELYQITEEAQLKLRINLMKRAKRLIESIP